MLIIFKVLIIDDDDQFNDTIRDIFLEKGYAVKIARTGKEALNIASQENFDGMFIDIRLPDMNGMTLFKELKLKYPKSSYFLITGYGNLQNAVQAFKNGANGYYLKPLIIEDIIQRVQDLLEKKKLQQEIAESEKKYREAFIESEFYRDLLTHDFNNILQSIYSGIQLNELYLENPEKLSLLKSNFKIIKEQLERAARLISNVRKLSNLEKQEISIEKIELLEIFENTISYIKNRYNERIINIEVNPFDDKIYVMANALIEEVFENILDNAVKHNKNLIVEVKIIISREVNTKQKKYIKIQIKDNGIGIENSRRKVIFSRKYSDDKKINGRGLGLSLVKHIMEKIKGKVWVEDKIAGDYSKGSNFILLIPEVI